MLVMNDRPSAASAYYIGNSTAQSRVEFLFARRGVSNDQLGVWEQMDEMNERGLPINYTMKYYMTFTTSR